MLKIFNSRLNHVCRHISTSTVRWQGGELTKARESVDSIRNIEKKPQREPLVKNFFLGRIDTELIAYPEAIYENEHLNSATRKKNHYEDFLASNIFSDPDDVNNVRKLKEFGAFRNISPLVTETIYEASETEAPFLSYSTFLNSHQQVLKLVAQFGDPAVQLKFLPKLESGDLTAVPCLFESEPSGNPKKMFTTEAVGKPDQGEFILNGEKSFVLLSPAYKDSTLFLVIASMETTDHVGDFKDGLIALLVDGSMSGVSIAGVDGTIGLDGRVFNQVTVAFKDVVLGQSNVLAADGFPVAVKLLSSTRLNKGVQVLGGVMKPLLKELVEYSIDTKIQGVNMKDVDIVKEQLGALTSECYALESMIFMTAGLADIYEEQDVEVESAMVQAFAVQALTDFIVRPLHFIGPKATIKGGGFERHIRDAVQLAACGESFDSLRQFIGLSGANHAGIILNEIVRKDRNPLNHPAFVFSRIFKQTSIESPKKKFHLDGFLHPSLQPVADFLELSILRMNAATDILLARHGSLIVEHTVEVAKLAEAATLCYAMFAAAARASRSYCIGLRNSDQEIHLSSYFCYQSSERVKAIAKEIDNGEYGTGEYTFKAVGEKLIATKKYLVEHPTTRNF